MRGSSFYLLLCQLGLAATALGQETVDYSISEFDFIIPRPGVTYELGPDHRLPIVIAVQNATLWRNSVIDWTLNNYTLADSPEQLLFGDRFQLLKDGPEQQWLRYDTILAPSGTYHLDWNFLGRPCVNSSSLSYGFSFKTGPGGNQTSVRDAAKETCPRGPSLLYRLWEGGGCDVVAERAYDEEPNPCHLNTDYDITRNVTNALDDQFKKRCGGDTKQSDCVGYKKSSALRLSSDLWLLSLSLAALTLVL